MSTCDKINSAGQKSSISQLHTRLCKFNTTISVIHVKSYTDGNW